MASDAMALAMMSGGGQVDPGDDGQSDPMGRLRQAMILQSMQSMQNKQGDEGETGGEVGKRSIDSGTTPPSNATAGTDDLESRVRPAQAIRPSDVDASAQGTVDKLESPLPTTFPATEKKNTAHDLLVKAQNAPEAQPWSTKKRVLTSLAGLIPIAGPAFIGMQNAGYRQGQRSIQLAREEYNTEASLEQQQRDQALRERVAQANIETSRAMKTLMAGIASHKTDVQEEIGTGRTAVSGAKSGYDVSVGPDGHTNITAKPAGDLSELQRRSMEVQQATVELKKAQTLAVPENIENKKKALDIANQHLSAYLQNQSFNQDMHREGQDFREFGPTTQMRDRSQQANVIGTAGNNLIKDITTNGDHLGPIMGRYGTLTDFLGAPPPEFARLASELTTYIALQPAAHGFKGMRAVQEFEKSIGTPIRTPAALIAAIQGNMAGLSPMAAAGGNFHPSVRATPQNLLKKNGNNGSGNTSTRTNTSSPKSRSVTRDAQGNLTFAQ